MIVGERSGESANPIKAKEIVENGIHYYNAYGATEYSVMSSIYKADPSRSLRYSTIGKPISNTEVYILDDDLSVVTIAGCWHASISQEEVYPEDI
ncbi:hypothetical protein FQA39_LY18896 [Lamprigera yunnana]|nr:hypothetical protein FQA39_LY18896 [Lamprigera yunnana]